MAAKEREEPRRRSLVIETDDHNMRSFVRSAENDRANNNDRPVDPETKADIDKALARLLEPRPAVEVKPQPKNVVSFDRGERERERN